MRTYVKPEYVPIIKAYYDPKLTYKEIATRLVSDKVLEGSINYVRSLVRIVEEYHIDKERLGVVGKDLSFDKLFPQSLLTERQPFFIWPDGLDNILVINDLHIPYFQRDALEIALNYGRKVGVNAILINGDLIDFYAISRFEKIPKKRDLPGEIDITCAFLSALRSYFPNIPIYWKHGNHEDRFNAALLGSAPDFYGLKALQFSRIFNLDALNIKEIDSLSLIYMGGLTGAHGHELRRNFFGSGGTPARSLYNKVKCDLFSAHSHLWDHWEEKTVRHESIIVNIVACLANRHPEYNPSGRNDLGFGNIKLFDSGSHWFNNFKIEGTSVIPRMPVR